MAVCSVAVVSSIVGLRQPPLQALHFSHGRGERETRVTGDEPQGTMGRVQTAGEAPSRPLSPSRLPLRAHFHQKRDVWVRGRRQNVYECVRLSISGLFFSHTFQSDQSLPRAFGFILCAACGSVLLLHAARVLTIL